MQRILSTFIIAVTVLLFQSIVATADEVKRKIDLRPPKTISGNGPHAPSRIPLLCELEGNQIVITADYPVMLVAEVTANDNAEVVADYFSAEAATIHQFTVDPQNTTLTIEIQVGDKTYIGEFFS